MKIEKIETKIFGVEVNRNGMTERTITVEQDRIEKIAEKLNEVIEYLNSKKDQLI